MSVRHHHADEETKKRKCDRAEGYHRYLVSSQYHWRERFATHMYDPERAFDVQFGGDADRLASHAVAAAGSDRIQLRSTRSIASSLALPPGN
jgi:hypothetical protein